MGQRFVVCAQGDPSFSARELINQVAAVWRPVKIVPGVSSAQTVCARAGLNMDRSLFSTFHKRADTQVERQEFLQAARNGTRNLLVLPRSWDFMPVDMARYLVQYGVSEDRRVSVYERMTLADEHASTWKLAELGYSRQEFSDLSIFVLPTDAGNSDNPEKEELCPLGVLV